MKQNAVNKKLNKKFAKGFTLLELLVVVIIIAILAAIAFPQYQLAVDKAEFTKYQSMVASLRDAYNEYVLIHGEGTKKFENLSLNISDDWQGFSYSAYNCMQNNTMFCCMTDSSDSHSGQIVCGKNDFSFAYRELLLGRENDPLYGDNHICVAKENNSRANRLCASLGIKADLSNLYTPDGTIFKEHRSYLMN